MNAREWKKCAVIGAAGKMGRGIALILLLEMTASAAKANKATLEYRLVLIDANENAMDGLRIYLRSHLQKYAERQINQLRAFYKDNKALISNKEMIEHFVDTGMQIVHCGTVIEEVIGIPVIFEAIIEDLEAKCALFKKINALQKDPPVFLTNTSSIPISQINENADLKGRVIGFHLYNPPAVQKLLEIIPLNNGDPELFSLALDIGQRLGKKIVISKDVAGFIGNGHFLREITLAAELVKELSKSYMLTQSIYMANKVTGEFLLRPMGMFQLIDYVGLDVMHKVGDIMNKALNKSLFEPSIFQPLMQKGLIGGQHADGAQKNGFFKYQDHSISGIFDADKGDYIDLAHDQFSAQCDQKLGTFPEGYFPWSTLSKDSNREAKIKNYLQNLKESQSPGSQLAYQFLINSQKIVDELVKTHVANSREDVETVLKNGFYHLYGKL